MGEPDIDYEWFDVLKSLGCLFSQDVGIAGSTDILNTVQPEQVACDFILQVLCTNVEPADINGFMGPGPLCGLS